MNTHTPQYWLIKSEPGCYSLSDLKRDTTTHWDGIRNYQARNFIKNDMRIGDKALFHHSNATPSGIAGIATIAKPGYPDFTAFDPKHDHFDPKSKFDTPTWWMMDVTYAATFTHFLSLATLHSVPELSGLMVLQRGCRLSIQPVSEDHFNRIVELGNPIT